MASLNKLSLIGNVGKDPEIRAFQNGDRVANFSVATTESYTKGGERKEVTQWHNIVVYNQGLIKVVEAYVSKGRQVYIEGQLKTREYTRQDGTKGLSVECVLGPYNSTLVLVGGNGSNREGNNERNEYRAPASTASAPKGSDLDDEVPF